MKYKTMLFVKIKEEEEFKKRQNVIKEKHNIQDDNVIVVEKNNMFKFLVKLFLSAVKFIAAAVILILAGIGLTALIYPRPRAELFVILNQVINDILNML